MLLRLQKTLNKIIINNYVRSYYNIKLLNECHFETEDNFFLRNFQRFFSCMFSLPLSSFLGSFSTVSICRWSTERIHNSEGLCVLAKLFHIWIFMCSSSLTLAAKKTFQRVLAKSLTKERLHSMEREEVGYKFNERFNC